MKRKVFALVLAAALAIGCLPAHVAAASTVAQITARLEAIYAVDKYRNAGYSSFDNMGLGSGCYAFVNAVSRQLFGVGIPSQGSDHISLVANANWACVGQAKNSNSDVVALLKHAQPGDIMQYKSNNTNSTYGHIVMVYAVSSSSISFWDVTNSVDNNGNHKCPPSRIRTPSWDKVTIYNTPGIGDFSASGYGLSLYRCTKNVSTAPIDGAGSGTTTPDPAVDCAPPVISAPASSFYYEGQTVTISWNAVQGASHYVYYLTEFPESFAYSTNTQTATVTANSVSFSGLRNGHYSLFAHAVNSAGKWSDQSNWVSFDVYKDDYIPTATGTYNGHLYAVYDCEISWSAARDLCAALGGHLCTITDEGEKALVYSLIIDHGTKDSYWLGAENCRNYYTGLVDYQWITGEPFTYTDWLAGEPSCTGSGGDQEAFLEVRKSYGTKWNDVNNTNCSNKGFVLEMDISNLMATNMMSFGNNIYYLFSYAMPWTEAEAICEAMGGHLAVYDSEEEYQAVTAMIGTGFQSWYHIGATRDANGAWTWVTGKPLVFSGYLQENPSYYDAKGRYLMQYGSGGMFAGLRNVYQPLAHQQGFGFVCELENAAPYCRAVEEDESIRVTPYNVAPGCQVLLAAYRDDTLSDVAIVVYQGEALTFPKPADADKIKVLVLNTLSDLHPLCDVVTLDK